MREPVRLRSLGLAFAGALLALAPAACLAADQVTETRAVSGFARVELNGAFTVTIRAGRSRTHLVVSGDRDQVARVTTEVRGGTLVVGMRSGGFAPFSARPQLDIDVPELRAVSNSGAGKITVSGLTGGDVSFENAGAAKVIASGRAERLNISLDGAGRIDATGLDAHDVTVENNGVGSVRVRVSGTLTATINGVGEIRYAGNPTHVQSEVNGVGRISRI